LPGVNLSDTSLKSVRLPKISEILHVVNRGNASHGPSALSVFYRHS
jgi:hypothetical protein